jgi:diguanylate cyclase (GGDEF)-like protein
LRVGVVGVAPDLLPQAASPCGPFDFSFRSVGAEAALAPGSEAVQAWLLGGRHADDLPQWPALGAFAPNLPVVVVLEHVDAAAACALLQQGVQDVVPLAQATPQRLGLALRLAAERKRLEQAARKAMATDLATGLPDHAQLLEHMSHLLALREREPAPMALLVLRAHGLAQAESALGAPATQVLRRKAAVRLRAALRASDVVASIGADAFAVLLARMESADDAERVLAKLSKSMVQPFSVMGRSLKLQVSAGLARCPEHGRDAGALLQRAWGQAATLASMAEEAPARAADRGPQAAANDEG